MLYQKGFNVVHFTSPHLLNFNERFWLNGKNLADEILEEAFLELDFTLLKKASYFEVLTFLAFRVFRDCDYLVLEAGLGGEFDSTTTCFKRDLTLFTHIGIDHQEYLGETIEEIATTKLNAMSKKAILGIQRDLTIVRLAKKITQEKQANLHILEKQDILPSIKEYSKKHAYPKYQEENLTMANFGLTS